MAQVSKGKRPAGKPAAVAGEPVASHRADPRLKALERERDDLRAELEQARARIAALEESRRQVASRIDWVIDSLHGLIDKDA